MGAFFVFCGSHCRVTFYNDGTVRKVTPQLRREVGGLGES
nr:MAG TPA: protein of unknown function (DUF3378) [Caudoviricetes sp.]